MMLCTLALVLTVAAVNTVEVVVAEYSAYNLHGKEGGTTNPQERWVTECPEGSAAVAFWDDNDGVSFMLYMEDLEDLED